jgi:hypothetical protein
VAVAGAGVLALVASAPGITSVALAGTPAATVPQITVAAQFPDGESCVSNTAATSTVNVTWPAASIAGLTGYQVEVLYYLDGGTDASPTVSVAANQTTATVTVPNVPGPDAVLVTAEVNGGNGPVVADGTLPAEGPPTPMSWDVNPGPGVQAVDTGPRSSVGNGTVTINADILSAGTDSFVQPYTSATLTISPGGASLPGPEATFAGLTNGQKYSFTQTLTNECGSTTTTIGNAIPEDVVVTAPAQTTGTVGQEFSQSFAASGGTAPYYYTLGAVAPSGLSFDNETGVLSGEPTTPGQYDLTVSVLDSVASGDMPPMAQPATVAYDLTIEPSTQAPSYPPPGPPAPPTSTSTTSTSPTSTPTTTTSSTLPTTTTSTTTTNVKATAPVGVAQVEVVSSSAVAAKGLLPVQLSCAGAACTGSIEIIGKAGPGTARSGANAAPVVVAKGIYAIAKGRDATVMLKLTATGRTVVSGATGTCPLSEKVQVSVKGGEGTTKAVLIS